MFKNKILWTLVFLLCKNKKSKTMKNSYKKFTIAQKWNFLVKHKLRFLLEWESEWAQLKKGNNYFYYFLLVSFPHFFF